MSAEDVSPARDQDKPKWPDFFRSPEEGWKYAELGLVSWCQRCGCWHLLNATTIEKLKALVEADRG